MPTREKGQTKRAHRGNNSYGMPGNIGILDRTFESPSQMARALDAFLAFLHGNYGGDAGHEQIPRLLGLFITRMKVIRDSKVEDVEVVSELGRGLAVIHAPRIRGESKAAWQHRQKELLSLYWPTLEDAKIRAAVQLYSLIDSEGRRWIEKKYPPKLWNQTKHQPPLEEKGERGPRE